MNIAPGIGRWQFGPDASPRDRIQGSDGVIGGPGMQYRHPRGPDPRGGMAPRGADQA